MESKGEISVSKEDRYGKPLKVTKIINQGTSTEEKKQYYAEEVRGPFGNVDLQKIQERNAHLAEINPTDPRIFQEVYITTKDGNIHRIALDSRTLHYTSAYDKQDRYLFENKLKSGKKLKDSGDSIATAKVNSIILVSQQETADARLKESKVVQDYEDFSKLPAYRKLYAKQHRRSFMRGAVGVAGVLAASRPAIAGYGILAGIEGKNVVDSLTPQETPEDTVEQRFRNAGVANFIKIYELYTQFNNELNVIPISGESEIDMPENTYLYDILDAVAGGRDNDYTRNGLEALTKGWNQEDDEKAIKEAVQAAQTYLTKIPIDTSATKNDDNPDSVRKAFMGLAKTMPHFMLAYPGIKTHYGGGGDSEYDKTDIQSPKEDPEMFLVAAFHEGNHQFDANWYTQRVKDHMTQNQFINYLEAKLEFQRDACKLYFDMSWKDAQYILGDRTPLIRGIISSVDYSEEEIIQAEEDFKIDMSAYTSPPPPDGMAKNDIPQWLLTWRYNHLAHEVGKKILQIGRKGGNLSPTDTSLLNDERSGYLITGIRDELSHMGIGPIQRQGGGLPHDIADIDGGAEAPLTSANLRMQQKKLAALSTLATTKRTVAELRTSLGLPA